MTHLISGAATIPPGTTASSGVPSENCGAAKALSGRRCCRRRRTRAGSAPTRPGSSSDAPTTAAAATSAAAGCATPATDAAARADAHGSVESLGLFHLDGVNFWDRCRFDGIALVYIFCFRRERSGEQSMK